MGKANVAGSHGELCGWGPLAACVAFLPYRLLQRPARQPLRLALPYSVAA
jgi:hypothetical protein